MEFHIQAKLRYKVASRRFCSAAWEARREANGITSAARATSYLYHLFSRIVKLLNRMALYRVAVTCNASAATVRFPGFVG